jgi:hypothetical protein
MVTLYRCDALFFDPVKMDCQHYFCRACIEPCSDCLMCGADIHKRTPEPKLEGVFMGISPATAHNS